MSEPFSQRSRVILLYTGFVACFGVGVVIGQWSVPLVGPESATTAEPQTPGPRGECEFSESVHIVKTLDDWDALLQNGRHVLFVDCDWNVAMVAFRRPFSKFSDWCREETNYRSASVKMIASGDHELSKATQDLMRSNGIFLGGMKTYGGAGRVIWLEDGRVLDYEWCHELLNDPSKLKARSRKAFRQCGSVGNARPQDESANGWYSSRTRCA